jgi:hypothetical protein
MTKEEQRIIATVAHSGTSLLLTLTKQLRKLGVKPGDSVSVTWDAETITIRRPNSH